MISFAILFSLETDEIRTYNKNAQESFFHYFLDLDEIRYTDRTYLA